MCGDAEWSEAYGAEYEPGNLESWAWPRAIAKLLAKSHRIGKVASVDIHTEERDSPAGHLIRFQIWAETPKKTTEMDIIIVT
jgi:hypothetical protein